MRIHQYWGKGRREANGGQKVGKEKNQEEKHACGQVWLAALSFVCVCVCERESNVILSVCVCVCVCERERAT